jgi:proteasome lid subunit RPN8/RPN11
MISMSGTSLDISEDLYRTMLNHVEKEKPLEACGLLAGKGSKVLIVRAISNILNSPIRFRMEPQEQITAFNEFEVNDWDLLAIYHSHPKGPAFPSNTDISEAFYPEAISVIWSCYSGKWNCRAWRISSGKIDEINLHIYQ